MDKDYSDKVKSSGSSADIGVSGETRKSPLQRAGEGIFSCELDEREGEGQALQAEQGSFDSFLEGYPRAIIGVLKAWITYPEGDTYGLV